MFNCGNRSPIAIDTPNNTGSTLETSSCDTLEHIDITTDPDFCSNYFNPNNMKLCKWGTPEWDIRHPTRSAAKCTEVDDSSAFVSDYCPTHSINDDPTANLPYGLNCEGRKPVPLAVPIDNPKGLCEYIEDMGYFLDNFTIVPCTEGENGCQLRESDQKWYKPNFADSNPALLDAFNSPEGWMGIKSSDHGGAINLGPFVPSRRTLCEGSFSMGASPLRMTQELFGENPFEFCEMTGNECSTGGESNGHRTCHYESVGDIGNKGNELIPRPPPPPPASYNMACGEQIEDKIRNFSDGYRQFCLNTEEYGDNLWDNGLSAPSCSDSGQCMTMMRPWVQNCFQQGDYNFPEQNQADYFQNQVLLNLGDESHITPGGMKDNLTNFFGCVSG